MSQSSLSLKAVTLGKQLDHLHSLIAPQVFANMADKMVESDFSFRELNAIFFVFANDAARIDDIAKSIGLSHAATSRLVDRLTKSQFLVRKEDSEDRRQKRVTLGKKGRELLNELKEFTASAYSTLLAEISKQDMTALTAALAAVQKTIPPHPLS